MPFPTPHLEKLTAVLDNEKLPPVDKPRIVQAIERYRQWIADLDADGHAAATPHCNGRPVERVSALD